MKLSRIVFSASILVTTLLYSTAGQSNTEIPIDSWAVGQIQKWSPPGVTYYPDAKESEEEARERYAAIVKDLLRVVYDPEEKPLFTGSHGRARTASLLLSIAQTESGFRRDVDFGIGKDAKGDSGESHCLMQIRLSKMANNGKTSTRIHLDSPLYSFSKDDTGYGGEDLLRDRTLCFRAALHIARQSIRSCHNLPAEERLGVYTSGDCERGRRSSRVRMLQARSIFEGRHLVPDADIMEVGIEKLLDATKNDIL